MLTIEDESKEIWKDVVGYEGFYKVSTNGKIKSIGHSRGIKILSPGTNTTGYLQVNISNKKTIKMRKVHRLVAQAFLGESNGLQVNHKNGIKVDNRLDNLEYCTPSENVRHAFRIGVAKPTMLGKFGKYNNKSKKVSQYNSNHDLIGCFDSTVEASKATGVSTSSISQCCTGLNHTAGGYIWKYKVNLSTGLLEEVINNNLMK